MTHVLTTLTDAEVMLLRVGRYSGAENVTLDGVRSIKIGGGMLSRYSPDGALTVWLAAEHEKSRTGMLPFGWVLVHEKNQPGMEILSAWCEQQPGVDVNDIRQKLLVAQEKVKEQREHQKKQAESRKAQEAMALQKAQELEAIRAAMTPQARAIQDFLTKCEEKLQFKTKDPLNPGMGLYAEALKLCKAALEDTQWSAEDRKKLADTLTEWLPKVVQKLDQTSEWKDARKKLKLGALTA